MEKGGLRCELKMNMLANLNVEILCNDVIAMSHGLCDGYIPSKLMTWVVYAYHTVKATSAKVISKWLQLSFIQSKSWNGWLFFIKCLQQIFRALIY